MHIPDGFVSTPINAVAAAAAAGAVGVSLWRVTREARERTGVAPLLATTAAFVFAAQMLNFPIGGGTSGHFLGAVAAAALLGPWASCLVMTVVLVVQCLLFADGGLSALGTNILNMGIVGGWGGWLILRAASGILPQSRGGRMVAVFAASWASVVAASTFCAFQLAFSGTSPLSVALPAMAGVHVVIGIGEGLITTAVIAAVMAARPDVLPAWVLPKPEAASSPKRVWAFAAAGLAVALLLAAFLSPFASSSPDGLERVAEDKGFLEAAADEGQVLWKASPFPDYTLPPVSQEGVSTGLAGLIGTVVVFAAGFAAIRLFVRRPASAPEQAR